MRRVTTKWLQTTHTSYPIQEVGEVIASGDDNMPNIVEESKMIEYKGDVDEDGLLIDTYC